MKYVTFWKITAGVCFANTFVSMLIASSKHTPVALDGVYLGVFALAFSHFLEVIQTKRG